MDSDEGICLNNTICTADSTREGFNGLALVFKVWLIYYVRFLRQIELSFFSYMVKFSSSLGWPLLLSHASIVDWL